MDFQKELTVYITFVAFALHPNTVGPAHRSLNGTRFILRFRSLAGPPLRANRW
jgi:hypothetical protein